MKKILIALDDTASAMRAVDYAGRQFAGIGDIEIALVHVLPNLPALFWDEGHILNDEEKKERKKVVEKWIAGHKAKMEPVFRKASETLSRAGVKAQQIIMSILEEAKDGAYQTVVVGRCNHSARHLLGSVSGKIVNHGTGLTVAVVG